MERRFAALLALAAAAGAQDPRLAGGALFERRLAQLTDGEASQREVLAEELEAQGLLPELSLGGLRLQEVYTISRRTPWKSSRTVVPSGYQLQTPGGRRLVAPLLEQVSETPASYETPRDKVRLMAALNAASLPTDAFANGTRRYMTAPSVYDASAQAFASAAEAESASASASNSSLAGLQRAGVDLAALLAERADLREAIGSSWKEDLASPDQTVECAKASALCGGEVGVALSLYQDATHQVLVFHGGWDGIDLPYLLWTQKVWILEQFELQARLAWSLKAQQLVTTAVSARSGDADEELAMRCAFNDEAREPMPDAEELAEALEVPLAELQERGYWIAVKDIVRQLLPEGSSQELTTFLTGSGKGGTFAALVSMWLAKVDAQAYETYVFASDGGWQCLARSLYSADMNPWDTHAQLRVYAHVFDTLSTSVDRLSGQVCLYGRQNFTAASAEYGFCERIVGHTGPQLFYRGADPAPSEAVAAARRAFDACSYFTHSVWFAAMLFASEDVLMIDGTTDGGCYSEELVPEVDYLEKCPLKTTATEMCLLSGDTVQAIPISAMLFIGGGTAGFILCMASLGYLMLRRVRNEVWVFGSAGGAGAGARPSEDISKQARERARNNRAKQGQKQQQRRLRQAAKAVRSLAGLGAAAGAGDGAASTLMGRLQDDGLAEKGEASGHSETADASLVAAGVDAVEVQLEGGLELDGQQVEEKKKRKKAKKKEKECNSGDEEEGRIREMDLEQGEAPAAGSTTRRKKHKKEKKEKGSDRAAE